MKNRLIVFEGIDGTGKTTLSKELVSALKRKGISAVRYEDYEQKNTGFNLVKPFVKKHASIDASLFFYLSSSIHKSKAITALLRKHWVICDRYVFSTLADHKARGANMGLVPPLRKFPVYAPDFLFLLTTQDEAVRLGRIKVRKNNKPHDYVRKTKGSFPAKMEQNLKAYKPTILDNSRLTAAEAMKQILDHIGF